MNHEHHGDPATEKKYAVKNMPHQHAFTLVGRETVFGVHMTQYHTEEHKYQLILKFELPSEALIEFQTLRKTFPSDFFVLCNDHCDQMTVPDLAAGERPSFKCNIFQGFRQFTQKEAKDHHFFPWALTRVEPVISKIKVRIERVVLYRVFAHHYELPEFATYYLFGSGSEAHMTNLQTASLATGPFEAQAFGPDYDHVMSLEAEPDWLHPTLLEAGVVVTTPAVRLWDRKTGTPTIPCGPPFKKDETVEVLYRGIGPVHTVTAAETVLCATAVCNSPSTQPCPGGTGMYISATPDYLQK